MTHWPMLFSYGSNDRQQLAERLGRNVTARPGFVRGYQRVFRGHSRKWGGGVASLERKAGAITYGALVPVDEGELAVLDRFEGVASGNYRRDELTIESPTAGACLAIAYLATSRTFGQPTQAYLEQVARTVGQVWTSDTPVTWRSFPVR